MFEVIKVFIITFVVFMGIDLIWLGLISKKMYAEKLGFIMRKDVNWPVALAFYVLFMIGLLFFVVYPAIDKGSWSYALLAGMFFGLVTYGTYDLTNLSTLKDWPVSITVIDLIWGSSICGMTSLISFLIFN